MISSIVIPPTLFFFLKTAEAIVGCFWFHVNFWNICSKSVKCVIGILIGIVLNLWITLGSMDILMMLIHPIHKHSICFYFKFCSPDHVCCNNSALWYNMKAAHKQYINKWVWEFSQKFHLQINRTWVGFGPQATVCLSLL